MKKLALTLLIAALGCTSTTYNVNQRLSTPPPANSATPPAESATTTTASAPVASTTPAPVEPAKPVESSKAVTPPTPTPPTASSAPATSPEGFRAKVEAKCLAKHPEGKLTYKACVALRMGAVRAACRMATGKNPEALCKEHPNYCTPEVQEMVYEGLSFCDTFAKEKEE